MTDRTSSVPADPFVRVMNARDNYKALWDQSCSQIADMCSYLGVDPEKEMADAWTLRDEIVRLKAESERLKGAIHRCLSVLTARATTVLPPSAMMMAYQLAFEELREGVESDG